jgi:hypothetical protein
MTIHTSSPARLHNKIQTKPDAKANTCSIDIAALPAAASTIDCVHSWQPLEMSRITEDVSIEEDYSRANAIDENEEKDIRFSPSLPLPPSPVSSFPTIRSALTRVVRSSSYPSFRSTSYRNPLVTGWKQCWPVPPGIPVLFLITGGH